jgi:hypothetical protein
VLFGYAAPTDALDRPTPWIGLLALVAMFAIPFLPSWLFEGPRTVKHWPRRHVCAVRQAPWTDGHLCLPEVAAAEPVTAGSRLRGELRRAQPGTDLAPRRVLFDSEV